MSIDEIKHIVLKDKREIHLNDENDISLSVIFGGKTEFSFPIPYPQAGYGGGSLYISPSQLYLLFSYYSGQSEEAFTLFRFAENRLNLVFESPYLYWEAASYCFSQNEKLLIQGLPNSCTWDWKDYMEQGYAEEDEAGNQFFVFGYINILDIANKVLNEHLIRVYISEDSENFSEEKYNPFMLPIMKNDTELTITMPWGEETLIFPLEDVIIFRLK